MMSQKGRRTAGHILLVIFVLYYTNICFFYHGHIINGVTIEHSHFHDREHTQTGMHTDSELTLISALSVFQAHAATSFFAGLAVFLAFAATVASVPCGAAFASGRMICISLRAPPFLLCAERR